MKKCVLLSFLFACLFVQATFADKGKKEKKDESVDSLVLALNKYAKLVDSVNKAMDYRKGLIKLKGDFAVLNVPENFKFLNAEQSRYIIHDIWGNPERDDVLGMIFPADKTPFSDSSFAFVVTFDDMGYVKDDDAAKVKYDDLLKDMWNSEKESNKAREQAGYEPIHIVGWAQTPYYDSKKKVLHWAKELKFGTGEGDNTLNYDVRVLGRKGVLSLNAVASMQELPLVKQNIDAILKMASYTEGNAYADYNSGTDKIAAYTIGGLVAGKVLAKVGFFAILLKFGKFIIGGLVLAFYGVKKFFTGKGREDESYVVTETPAETVPAQETASADMQATEASSPETSAAATEPAKELPSDITAAAEKQDDTPAAP